MHNEMNLYKGKLGFGTMRLPIMDPDENGSVNLEQVSRMVDRYMEAGFNYFDTAIMYHNWKSEEAVGHCLSARYPRESFFLTDKVSAHAMKSREHTFSEFANQLKRCQVEYFDLYLAHNMTRSNYKTATDYGVFEWMKELKAKGLVKALGFSHHDSPELLQQILEEHPEMEYVQLQLNYLDWDDPLIQAGELYRIARDYHKKILVMEPLKGGNLVNLPESVAELFRSYAPEASFASWGIRYAAGLPGVEMVLSGMSDEAQMEDNLSYMKDFTPLNREEQEIVRQAAERLHGMIPISCTACDYCSGSCPMEIPISKYFALYNGQAQITNPSYMINYFYYNNLIKHHSPASACIECGSCEKSCPQHLSIIEDLKKVAEQFEKQ